MELQALALISGLRGPVAMRVCAVTGNGHKDVPYLESENGNVAKKKSGSEDLNPTRFERVALRNFMELESHALPLRQGSLLGVRRDIMSQLLLARQVDSAIARFCLLGNWH